ncbi:hypothetical protein, partial [Staphylococcus chromogenes]|uniref:hypothetical protein n=1 Tax=Staphylococcus chromogenes TaxID=46126 RepID=UPI000D42037E
THGMIEKALNMKSTTIQFKDLMTDDEKEKYAKMNRIESDSVRKKERHRELTFFVFNYNTF